MMKQHFDVSAWLSVSVIGLRIWSDYEILILDQLCVVQFFFCKYKPKRFRLKRFNPTIWKNIWGFKEGNVLTSFLVCAYRNLQRIIVYLCRSCQEIVCFVLSWEKMIYKLLGNQKIKISIFSVQHEVITPKITYYKKFFVKYSDETLIGMH